MGRNRLYKGGCMWLCLLAVFGAVWMFVAFFLDDNTGNETSLHQLSTALKQSYVYLGRKVTLDSILNRVAVMRSEGPKKLLVISDFDLTLTKYWVKGNTGCTSYRVLDTSSLMPEMYRTEALSLRDQFAPIENNHDLSVEEKTAAMEEWTSQANELLVKYRLSENAIPDIVAKANVELRAGFKSFSELLYQKEVLFLIFSAGLHHTITEILQQQQGRVEDNVLIVSNRMRFDDSGVAVGFSKPVIHSYIKEEILQQFSETKKLIQGRSNVVLLGDSVTDVKMLSGLDRVDHVIKIGFLNHNVEELLPMYADLYDVVLTGDASMDIPCTLMRAILG